MIFNERKSQKKRQQIDSVVPPNKAQYYLSFQCPSIVKPLKYIRRKKLRNYHNPFPEMKGCFGMNIVCQRHNFIFFLPQVSVFGYVEFVIDIDFSVC